MKNLFIGGILAMSLLVCAGCGTPSTGGDDAGGLRDAERTDASPATCTTDAQCDDGVDCTLDSCLAAGICRHRVAPAVCMPGESCDPVRGCTMGTMACASDADCPDDDACTTMERCDPAARVCTFTPLDGDGDGDPPRVCGGGDCDDGDATISSVTEEACNGLDDNCDGRADEGIDLMGDVHRCGSCDRDCGPSDTFQCVGGECACAPGVSSACGSCGIDLMGDPFNCGSCGLVCPEGRTCGGGSCLCPAPTIDCGGFCVDVLANAENCGMCGRSCGPSATCGAGSCICGPRQHTCSGLCVDDFDATACGPDCVACPTPANGVATCDGMGCGMLCDPGYEPYAGRCEPACPAGQHRCASSCVADDAVSACGASCMTCTAPIHGTAVCSAGSCGFTCDVGYVRMGSNCVPGSCGYGDGTTCDPVLDRGCGAGQGCYLSGPDGTHWCIVAGTGAEGSACSALNDCSPGMGCFTLGGSPTTCRLLCCGPGDDAACQDPARGGRPGLRCAVGPYGFTPIWICTP